MAAKTRLLKLSSNNLVVIFNKSNQNFQNAPRTFQKCSCKGPSVCHSDIFDSQWCCWSRQRTSTSVSTESIDQSISAPHTSKPGWWPTVIITRRMFPQTSLVFCWCSVDHNLIGPDWIFEGILAHALGLKDATTIHVWMEESDGSGNDTHNSRQRRWQNQLWVLWRENSGAVRAKGD